MELILNLTNYDYKLFLNSKIDTFVIALKGYSTDHLIEYDMLQLDSIIKDIHSHNKKIYLCLNKIANEKLIKDLMNLISQLKLLNIDGYIVSDFGILQLLKENSLLDKIIFNPITTITNKYSSNIINNLGINHVCIANELNLNDILEISKFNNGNIEILAQGYYQICNSKRPLITNFLKKFKIKSNSAYHYIKEESRDYAYPIIEIRDELLIYTDKQRCVLPYIDKLLQTKIKFYRIDTTFMQYEEINEIISIYHNAIKESKYDNNNLITLENLNSNLTCLDNVSILKKETK